MSGSPAPNTRYGAKNERMIRYLFPPASTKGGPPAPGAAEIRQNERVIRLFDATAG
jgi:hypothetical protein